jgi:hypothetical protein
MFHKIIAAAGAAVLLGGLTAVAATPAAASPAASPVATGTLPNAMWNGHLIDGKGGTLYEITSTFTVPVLTGRSACTAAEANSRAKVGFWAGLGGYASLLSLIGLAPGLPLVQDGVATYCVISDGVPTQQDYAWYEIIGLGVPQAYPPENLPTSDPVEPGDSVTATVYYTGGNSYELSLADPTQDWSWSLDCPSAGLLYCPASFLIPSGYPQTAETVVESPFTHPNMVDFGDVTFTNVRYYWAAGPKPGPYPVYVVKAPNLKTPETSVSKVLLTWTAKWLRAR